MAGTSGNASQRVAVVTPSARSLPDLMYSINPGVDEADLHLFGEQVRHCGRHATIRNVRRVDAGHHPEQLAEYVAGTPNAGRRHVDLARIGLGIGNELGNRFGRN